MRNSPGVSRVLSKASFGDRESVLKVLELVGGDDDRGRLALVRDRDPFPVPGCVAHQRLQGWNDRGQRDRLSHVASVPPAADTSC